MNPVIIRFRCLPAMVLCAGALSAVEDSLPPLTDGHVPQDLAGMWAGYDPRKEPLEAEVLKEWEEDGVVAQVVRYQVGIFKGAPARMVAFFAYPKGAARLPAILQMHGGGQSAGLDGVIAGARKGYACLSLNWGGNKLNFGRSKMTYDGSQTDWGRVDATHPPQRNKVNHFAGPLTPDAFTLDAVESPRNSSWFLVLIAARRALTYLELRPEVDGTRIGATGHSMGGKLTTNLAGIDRRVRAAVPSCGGSGHILESQTDLPGCVKTRVTDLAAACTSDNAYIPLITCPVLWLSPTNDFHAVIDNMAWNWRDVPDERIRFSITPHMNHVHTEEHAITSHLWFEQHLKNAFTMPATPQMTLDLKSPDGIPRIAVTPDGAMAARRVDVYYAIDPHDLTRFWRDAQAVRKDAGWQAACPVMRPDQAFFAFADVVYDLPAAYRKPGTDDAVFTISSRVLSASSARLQAAGIKATDGPERMIDDGARGWHDWYQSNWDHPPLWRATTRKLKDPKWRGPDGARLVFEIRPRIDCSLVVSFTCNSWGAFQPGRPAADHLTVKDLKGSDAWQTVTVTLDELEPADGKAKLADWRTVTEFSICPSGERVKDGQKIKLGGRAWQGPRDFRNLRWEGGVYAQVQDAGAAVKEEDHQRNFDAAIRRSLEQEALDRKPGQTEKTP